MKDLISSVIQIAIEAGNIISDIYHSNNFDIEIKSDNSPLTVADNKSHKFINDKLKSLFPEIPILSEEGNQVTYEIRKNWKRFWLVDPLDGTKEFINKNGEFTVNIALIENNLPVLGVIFAPAVNKISEIDAPVVKDEFLFLHQMNIKGVIYFGDFKNGSFRYSEKYGLQKLESSKIKSDSIVGIKSKSHSTEKEDEIFKAYKVNRTVSVGSSLKFCLVSEGTAQIYYRSGPTNEWDVGAGYAIAESAGAEIKGLKFNKQNLLNGSFLVKKMLEK